MPFRSSIFASGIQNLWGYFLKKRCRLPRKCGCIFPLVYQKGNIMGHLSKWKSMMLNSENLLLSRRVLLSNYLSFSSYFLMLLKSPRIASEPADSRNIVNFKKYARPSHRCPPPQSTLLSFLLFWSFSAMPPPSAESKEDDLYERIESFVSFLKQGWVAPTKLILGYLLLRCKKGPVLQLVLWCNVLSQKIVII